jgi:hypothetical protein
VKHKTQIIRPQYPRGAKSKKGMLKIKNIVRSKGELI